MAGSSDPSLAGVSDPDNTGDMVVLDPSLPILRYPGSGKAPTFEFGHNQRVRRSQILATIRRLLIERGLEGVTVRRIAETSGHAVQTIYNLVGPRNEAITQAINEYTRFVGRSAYARPEDPYAAIRMIHRGIQSIEANPAFCREVCLTFFNGHRDIYYDFVSDQTNALAHFLAKQQRCGVLRRDVDVNQLGKQLVLLASAFCLEWADRQGSPDRLYSAICGGYTSLLADKLEPAHRIAVANWPLAAGA